MAQATVKCHLCGRSFQKPQHEISEHNFCCFAHFQQWNRKRLAEIAELRQERNAKKTRIRLFMENMNSHQELVQSFDEELWYSTVDYVTVYEDKRLVFTFRDGRQVEITAELWRAA